MKRRLKEPFGKAGLIVGVIALVFAMLGGAYAAGGLSGKQKKEVEKIAKKLAGKPGTTGAAGAAGGAGPAGPKGEPGEQGIQGKEGKEGSPWTAGGTLPKGSTETGAFLAPATSTTEESFAVSFPIRLAAQISGANSHYVTTAEQAGTHPAECSGNSNAPTAAEGSLCVYESTLSSPQNEVEEALFSGHTGPSTPGADKTGAIVLLESAAPNTEKVGTWAVTAP